jgi:hypothetical protein
MKKKFLLCVVSFFLAAAGYSQDSSKMQSSTNPKNNSDTLHSMVPATGDPRRNPASPHATVNTNTGTAIPNTTSGTLNSTVNPNTQLVIPIHKSKKKSRSNITPDSGIIAPNNK